MQLTLGRRPAPARPGARPRVGMLIEPNAGWATYREHLERVAASTPALDTVWHDIRHHRAGGRIESAHDRWPRVLPAQPAAVARATLEFHRGLHEGPFDAIVTNSTVSPLFRGPLRRTPTLMLMDSTPQLLDDMPGYGSAPDPALVASLKFRMWREVWHAFTLIAATSRWARRGVIDGYGVPEEKVVVVPFGVDLSFWRPPSADRAAKRGPRRVLFVGGDFRRKGGPLLVEWFRARRDDGVELHVVTKEPVEPTPGVVVHRDIAANSEVLLRLYHDADVFVLPSLGEAFGIATTEAMGCGLPVVVSDVGGTADIVDEGVNGYITKAGSTGELAAALEALLADGDRRAAMGREGRRIAEERFGLDKTAQVVLDLVADLAAGRGPA